jgi:hypothetical protein
MSDRRPFWDTLSRSVEFRALPDAMRNKLQAVRHSIRWAFGPRAYVKRIDYSSAYQTTLSFGHSEHCLQVTVDMSGLVHVGMHEGVSIETAVDMPDLALIHAATGWTHRPYEAKVGDYGAMDVGIRHTVRKLHAQGWGTSDSGDGSKAEWYAEAMPFKHVVITSSRFTLVGDCDKLAELWPDWSVEGCYNPPHNPFVMITQEVP